MPPLGRLWGPFLVMGGINNLLPFSLIVWGQTQISGGLGLNTLAQIAVIGAAFSYAIAGIYGRRFQSPP